LNSGYWKGSSRKSITNNGSDQVYVQVNANSVTNFFDTIISQLCRVYLLYLTSYFQAYLFYTIEVSLENDFRKV